MSPLTPRVTLTPSTPSHKIVLSTRGVSLHNNNSRGVGSDFSPLGLYLCLCILSSCSDNVLLATHTGWEDDTENIDAHAPGFFFKTSPRERGWLDEQVDGQTFGLIGWLVGSLWFVLSHHLCPHLSSSVYKCHIQRKIMRGEGEIWTSKPRSSRTNQREREWETWTYSMLCVLLPSASWYFYLEVKRVLCGSG